MSSNRGGGYSSSGQTRLTLDDIQQIGNFFKNILKAEPGIKLAIYAAGIAGVVEVAHTVWLILRYVFKF